MEHALKALEEKLAWIAERHAVTPEAREFVSDALIAIHESVIQMINQQNSALIGFINVAMVRTAIQLTGEIPRLDRE